MFFSNFEFKYIHINEIRLTFSPPIPSTPVRLVHHQFLVDRVDDLLNFPLV
jgi:hypothetical protein